MTNESLRRKYPSEYGSWAGAKSRCNNKNHSSYSYYGGRGIKFCDRWKTFHSFINDMGEKPDSSYTLDRISVDGDYSPSNCRWVKMEDQCNNKRNNVFIEIRNERLTIAKAAKKYKIKLSTMYTRVSKGASGEKLITWGEAAPKKRSAQPRLTKDGITKSLKEWSKIFNVSYYRSYRRFKRGLCFDEIFSSKDFRQKQ